MLPPRPVLPSLLVAASLVGAVAVSAVDSEMPLKNHSFDLEAGSAVVCRDGATFTGRATGASSLNLQMRAQIFEQTGTTVIESGNEHTFTAVGEDFMFTVIYAPMLLAPGTVVALTVTDTPGTLSGNEGDSATATVADCTLPVVPALPAAALATLALLLAGAGALVVRRLV